MRYPVDVAFNHHNPRDRQKVLEGFDALLSEMREHLWSSEQQNDEMIDLQYVKDALEIRKGFGGKVNYNDPMPDITEEDLDFELQESRNDAIELSGHAIKRAREIRKLRSIFEKKQPVSEDVLEETAELFRNMIIRTAVTYMSLNRVQRQKKGIVFAAYIQAYKALSTVEMISTLWYPFDEALREY